MCVIVILLSSISELNSLIHILVFALQKYHGNLTLVPRFTTMQVFGLNALANPTVEDMKIYLQNGQAAAWPYLR